jgi:S-adenosylmethionine-diacylglycerol 3-amino-3-carboxypropyl transferase
MTSEAAQNADFTRIRYAQCWEDADVLLQALDVQPGDTCLTIASAGDNALALLARSPARVVAVDLNPAQLACLELRVAAYRELEHPELLELLGSRPSTRRETLFLRCRPLLTPDVRNFWDSLPDEVRGGIGGAGKFERYFALFRNRVLPLVHGRSKIEKLLAGGTLEERRDFYEKQWNSWRWNLMFQIFFSRTVMGKAGRDPAFFKYVEGSVATRILQRARYALTELNPAENPYLHWILTGTHGKALPFALREENFEAIRRNLDRLEWRLMPMEEFLDQEPAQSIDRFNLSDIFEYISPENTRTMLEKITRAGAPGARLAYWNTLAPRSRPDDMSHQIAALENLATNLHGEDKAFFYCRFIVEEILETSGTES